MFKLTGSAYQKLLEVVKMEKATADEHLYLRVSMGIGWGGPKLNLSLEERILKNDEVYDFDEVKILIHEKDLVYFNNTKLDYIVDPLGKGRFQLLKI